MITLSVGINNSEWPNQHFVTLLSERVTCDYDKFMWPILHKADMSFRQISWGTIMSSTWLPHFNWPLPFTLLTLGCKLGPISNQSIYNTNSIISKVINLLFKSKMHFVRVYYISTCNCKVHYVMHCYRVTNFHTGIRA